jgi:hypothetical protein
MIKRNIPNTAMPANEVNEIKFVRKSLRALMISSFPTIPELIIPEYLSSIPCNTILNLYCRLYSGLSLMSNAITLKYTHKYTVLNVRILAAYKSLQ